MSITRRLDAWLGKTLFHPPLIAFCQWSGFTQWKLARDLMFLAWCGILYGSIHRGQFGWAIVNAIFALLALLRATLVPATKPSDEGGPVFAIIRLAATTTLPLSIARLFAGDEEWHQAPTYLAFVFALYAATIVNIPPRKRKDRKTREIVEAFE